MLIPLAAAVDDLAPSHQELQRCVFTERREAALGELRSLTGLSKLVRKLEPDKVYRLVLPEGELLQKGKDGLYRGVLYRRGGKISAHAKFAKVPPSLTRIASAAGSQVLLVKIAVQLNRVEKAIADIAEELHNDRIAGVFSGIQQFELALHMTGRARRDFAVHLAIQSLSEGLAKVYPELRMRIDRLPEPRNALLDDWGQSMTRVAERELRLAEEVFRVAVMGASVLAECYAAMDESRAGAEALRRCLKEIASCGVESAAKKARLVKCREGQPLPEELWLAFDRYYKNFVDTLKAPPLGAEPLENGSVTVEFKKSELD